MQQRTSFRINALRLPTLVTIACLSIGLAPTPALARFAPTVESEPTVVQPTAPINSGLRLDPLPERLLLGGAIAVGVSGGHILVGIPLLAFGVTRPEEDCNSGCSLYPEGTVPAAVGYGLIAVGLVGLIVSTPFLGVGLHRRKKRRANAPVVSVAPYTPHGSQRSWGAGLLGRF